MWGRLLAVVAGVGLVGFACGDGGATGDEGIGSDESGSNGLGVCDVYDGKDEYLACVCEDVKPCVGFSREQCPQVLRSSLKYGQQDGGLPCTQAMGDFYECQFALTCPQLDQLNAYWSHCWDTDPGGQNQPYCRRETLNMVERCASISAPCAP